MRTFDLILPNLAQLMVLAAVTVVVLLIMGLGRLVSGRLGPAAAMVAGWGAAVFVFVVPGTLAALSFDVIAACLAAPSLVGLGLLVWDRSWGDPAWRRAGRIVVLSVPLILVVVGMRVSQWDELAQWLPNTQFLIAHHRFPSAALPNPGSTLPGYPYALPLVGYVTSLLPGGSSDRTGLLFNLLLLLAAAHLAAAAADRRSVAALHRRRAADGHHDDAAIRAMAFRAARRHAAQHARGRRRKGRSLWPPDCAADPGGDDAAASGPAR